MNLLRAHGPGPKLLRAKRRHRLRHGWIGHAPLRWIFLALCGLCLIFRAGTTRAADLESARALVRSGDYEKAIAAAQEGLREAPAVPEWPLILAQSQTELGRYADAKETLVRASGGLDIDLRVRLAAYEALRDSGATQQAQAALEEISRFANTQERPFIAPGERVALGKVALLLGGDPKRIMEVFFDPIRKEHPELRDSWLANGELALNKNDYSLASKTFQAAARQFPDDPDVQFGLARAYLSSDPEAARKAIENTLKGNPRHVGAHLLLADHYIDAEKYPEADAALAEALKTNPRRPETHAYRAVLAHLRADEKGEAAERVEALKPWPTNPAVPHLIGRKLSQKYRFAEGAAQQREALKFDPKYLLAKAQLANDLLRLGKDDEGWRLAQEVQAADPYDVVAYNLTVLRDAVKDFRTLSNEHFTLRMDPREADVYGADALALLERAHATLTKKYGLDLRERTIVEIFPDQKDFAIRTFGLPGGSGYLGVCFGRVITANSPASRPGTPSSWQAVLWHEFTHVVTLTLTKNKMPRWLSEGISVYEERQARPEWGEQMKPRYRGMLLRAEDRTPVSQLSAAFLQPKSPIHLSFAYYESSLVVEWLIERWGLDKVKRLLTDLARGEEINAALAAHFAPIEKLDAEFAEHAMTLARNTGPKLDWTPPKAADFAGEDSAKDFIAKHPNNFAALNEQAQQLIAAKKWQEAKAPLQKLIELWPDQHDADSAYAMLARAQRELGEADAELATLTRLAELSADATDAFRRLAQIAAERKQWAKVIEYTGRLQGVDPLQGESYRQEAEAREATGDRPGAVAAYRTLLRLDPADPPEIHYRLARLLQAAGDPAAKREVLLALENAPRFREALGLLLKIDEGAGASKTRPAKKEGVTP